MSPFRKSRSNEAWGPFACPSPDYSRDQLATEATEGTEDLRHAFFSFLRGLGVLCGSFSPA